MTDGCQGNVLQIRWFARVLWYLSAKIHYFKMTGIKIVAERKPIENELNSQSA
jgi:hypothetical protein